MVMKKRTDENDDDADDDLDDVVPVRFSFIWKGRRGVDDLYIYTYFVSNNSHSRTQFYTREFFLFFFFFGSRIRQAQALVRYPFV